MKRVCFRIPGPDGHRSAVQWNWPGFGRLAAALTGDDRAPAETAQVMVDFTHPDAVMDNLSCARQRHPRGSRHHQLHRVAAESGYAAPLLNMTVSGSW